MAGDRALAKSRMSLAKTRSVTRNRGSERAGAPRSSFHGPSQFADQSELLAGRLVRHGPNELTSVNWFWYRRKNECAPERREVVLSGVIDIMNYAPFVAPGLSGTEYQYEEFQTMVRTTLRPLLRDGKVTTQWGRVVAVDDPPTEADPTLHVEEAIASLDESGGDAVVLACLKMWSYRSHHQLIMDMPEEVVAEAVARGNGRFIGAAGYNPFRIDDSLRRIETFVRDHDFKYVYFHPITFGVAPNDRRCYPLYAKCAELGIPVGLQVGHSAEPLPSDIGRPMLVDDVAIDFPNLKINLSHTGWPWTGEFISMLWRHPNVYGDIAGYFPKTLDAELVRAMDRQLRHKVMLGSNGLSLSRCLQELDELPLREETKVRIRGENAAEFLGL